MWNKVLAMVGVLVFGTVVTAMACHGNGCRSHMSFSGSHMQMTGVFIDKAKVKRNGDIKTGSQAFAVQKTKGSYKANGPGIGATGGIGITTVSAYNTRNAAGSTGLAANISGSGVIGRNSCAKLKGSGEVGTVAVKGGGIAATHGKFAYKGQVSNGAIVGGGVTAGFSNVTRTKNSVTATAGHGTMSGITTIGGRGHRMP